MNKKSLLGIILVLSFAHVHSGPQSVKSQEALFTTHYKSLKSIYAASSEVKKPALLKAFEQFIPEIDARMAATLKQTTEYKKTIISPQILPEISKIASKDIPELKDKIFITFLHEKNQLLNLIRPALTLDWKSEFLKEATAVQAKDLTQKNMNSRKKEYEDLMLEIKAYEDEYKTNLKPTISGALLTIIQQILTSIDDKIKDLSNESNKATTEELKKLTEKANVFTAVLKKINPRAEEKKKAFIKYKFEYAQLLIENKLLTLKKNIFKHIINMLKYSNPEYLNQQINITIQKNRSIPDKERTMIQNAISMINRLKEEIAKTKNEIVKIEDELAESNPSSETRDKIDQIINNSKEQLEPAASIKKLETVKNNLQKNKAELERIKHELIPTQQTSKIISTKEPEEEPAITPEPAKESEPQQINLPQAPLAQFTKKNNDIEEFLKIERDPYELPKTIKAYKAASTKFKAQIVKCNSLEKEINKLEGKIKKLTADREKVEESEEGIDENYYKKFNKDMDNLTSKLKLLQKEFATYNTYKNIPLQLKKYEEQLRQFEAKQKKEQAPK